MNGVIFRETIKRSWRGALWWGLGLGLLAWVQIVAVPSVESIQQITEVMESMPPVMLQMFGASDMAFMATVEGYLALQIFAFLPLILAIYGAACGMNIVANEEERGIMDSLLSFPVTRTQIVREKALAYALLIVAVLVQVFIWIVIGLVMTLEIAAQVNVAEMGLATMGMIPITWIVMGFTALLTGLLRNRGLATTLIAVFVLASYFLNTLGSTTTGSILGTLRPLSYFSYFDSQAILQGGLGVAGMLVLTAATVIFVAGGMVGFQRRDVGV